MIEKLKELAEHVRSKKAEATNEESTKTAFIIPFFEILGYAVKDPSEFKPEYDASVGNKKDKRVDYSIRRNGETILIIEAKHHKENLDNHVAQLFYYYAATPAKFALLTNGIEYRFYADLDKKHVMDLKPFFVFDILDFDEQDASVLKNFRKNSFDIFKLGNIAEEMKYANQTKRIIKAIVDMPDDDFIRYVLSSIHKGKKTQQLVDKLRPIVKKSIDLVIDEKVNNRVEKAIEIMKKPPEPIEPETPISSVTTIISEINTTKEELEAFFNVKYILRNIIPWDKLHYRDAKNYFSILYDNKNYKWICRLRVEKTNKYIILPDGTPSGKSYPLDGLNGIFAYADELIESAKRFVDEQ